jgi:hypothetical protein
VVVASVLNNNALPFGDKASTKFKRVVASVKNKDSKGPTNDSPAKQHPDPNNNPAIMMGYYANFMCWLIVASKQRGSTTQTIFDDTLSGSEGAHAAPTTFNKASKLIVALTFEQSNITLIGKRHFQLIVTFCAQWSTRFHCRFPC